MTVMFQRMEHCNRRKQNRGETCRDLPAFPSHHASPSPTHHFSSPGGTHETKGSAGSHCSGLLHLPQGCSSAPATFPWSRPRHSCTLLRLCPLPPAPAHIALFSLTTVDFLPLSLTWVPIAPTPSLGRELPSDPHSPTHSQEHKLQSSKPRCFWSCTPGRDGA